MFRYKFLQTLYHGTMFVIRNTNNLQMFLFKRGVRSQLYLDGVVDILVEEGTREND